jgi:hypothetical protein
MMHPLIQRISLDLDSKDLMWIEEKIDLLKQMNLKPKVYETEHGFHVVAYLPKCRYISFWELINIRASLGDDPMRIQHDIKRMTMGYPVDTLFTIRRGKHNRIRRRNYEK